MIERADVIKRIGIGALAYDFKGQDIENKVFSLKFINTKYTALILIKNFSNNNLKTEIDSLKLLESLSIQYGLPIHIVCVYTGEDTDKWKEFAQNSNFKSWTNVTPIGNYEKALTNHNYDVFSDYAIFLLNQDKKILTKHLSAFKTAWVVGVRAYTIIQLRNAFFNIRVGI